MALTTRSKVAIYSTVFLSCISFSIVLPTLWPYLHWEGGTSGYLALVVATYSVGEASGALLFTSVLRCESTHRTMTHVMFVGLIGSLLYMVPNATCILCARLLQGVWTGAAQAVQTAYLADILSPEQLTPVIVTLNACASLGFVFGPAFGFAASLLPDFTVATLTVNQINAPGLAVVLASLACVAIFAFVFDESADRRPAPAQLHVEGGMNEDDAPHSVMVDNDSHPSEELLPLLSVEKRAAAHRSNQSHRMVGLVFCNCSFFLHFYGFAIQETVTT